MNKTILLSLVTIASFSLLTGCFANNIDAVKVTQNAVVTPQSTTTKEAVIANNAAEPKRPFSYLEQLPEERLREYELFVSDKDIRHFQKFSPEEMLLVYLQAAAMGDVGIIYPITYDDGSLPEPDIFRTKYYKEVMNNEMVIALDYRYFDSIKVNEDTIKENELAVVITASIGSFTSSVAYGLKKEDEIWKVDIDHLFESDN
ncbi:hypothetical protein H1230_23460 [Paenibacillus sp. 19GGS1-52]|uniref:hypothetical protein n=1 Tax=Paenibacillus sp. 19GGS1-52 TaxID=2758563 RepID=UPI001EFB70C9|nr:hypothetical protein [Paenibacillus sp. 19GGS1-52]ULO05978.1 hypothetical protein H1230_23460 [Paenibacillus sp. 19GGS1-52]